MPEHTPAAEDEVTIKVNQEIAELDKIAGKLNEMDKTLKEEGLKFSEAFNDPIEI